MYQSLEKKNQQEYFLQNRYENTERTFKAHDPSLEGEVTLRNGQPDEAQDTLMKELPPIQLEDDEFRQQIEKETLDKILNQEIVEFDDELGNLRGIGLRKNVQNIKVDPRVREAKTPNEKKDIEAGAPNVDASKLSQQGKPPTPRYRKPTVETILKNVKSQRQQDLSKNFRKENPNFKYSKDNVTKDANYFVLPQSQMLNQNFQEIKDYSSVYPTSNSNFGNAQKSQLVISPTNAAVENFGPAMPKIAGAAHAKDTDSSRDQSRSLHVLNSLEAHQQQKQVTGLRGSKAKPLGDNKKMFITLTKQQQQSQDQQLHALNEFANLSNEIQANINSQDGINVEPDSFGRQSVPMLEGADDGLKSLHTQGSRINFALPQPKAIKRQQSRKEQRIQLGGSDVTMYVGCIDSPEEEQDGLKIQKDNTQQAQQLSELALQLRESRGHTLQRKRELDAVKQTDGFKYYAEMKLKRFEGADRDIHEMSEMVDQMVAANVLHGGQTNVTESFNAIQREILDVSKETMQKFNINKKLPVNYIADKDAKKLNTAVQVKQLTNAFKVPKYSPVKFDRLSKGCSSVTPRNDVRKPPKHEVDGTRSPQLKYARYEDYQRDTESEGTPRKARKKGSAMKASVALLNMQNEVKMMTPTAQLRKLDFVHMDERQAIEHHNSLRTALWQRMKHGIHGSLSASPPSRRGDFNFQNTNLKTVTTRHCNGNIEDNFSMTTRIISGHNTPLSYMRKKKEKYLNQINQEQDELLQKLKHKQKQLEFRSLKASTQFDSFVLNLPQAEQPDPRTDEGAKLYQNIKQARQSMFIHKMRPLQRTQSFDSWRSEIEKQIDNGLTFELDTPSRFDKHLQLINKRKAKAADDAELELAREQNELMMASPQKVNGQGLDTQNTQISMKSDNFLKRHISEKRQQPVARKQESQLRVLEIQLQEQRADQQIEVQADQFFKTEIQEEGKKPQRTRKALLDRVRQRLKQKTDRTHGHTMAIAGARTLGMFDDASRNQGSADSEPDELTEQKSDLLERERVERYNRDRGVQVLSPASPAPHIGPLLRRNTKGLVQTLLSNSPNHEEQELMASDYAPRGQVEEQLEQPKTIERDGNIHMFGQTDELSQQFEDYGKKSQTMVIHENQGPEQQASNPGVQERIHVKSNLISRHNHHRRNLTRQNEQQMTLSPKQVLHDQFSSQNQIVASTLSTKNKSNQGHRGNFGPDDISNSVGNMHNVSNELFSNQTKGKNTLENTQTNTLNVHSDHHQQAITASESASPGKQFASIKSSYNGKSGRNLAKIQQNLQAVQDESSHGFNTRNDQQRQSLGYITTMDGGKEIQPNNSLADVAMQNQRQEKRRILNMNKPKTAGAKRNGRDLRHILSQAQSQNIEAQPDGRKYATNAQSQATFPYPEPIHRYALQSYEHHIAEGHSPPDERSEGQASLPRRASLWIENFAARRRIGYKQYHDMTKKQRTRMNNEIKKKWLKSNQAPQRIMSALPSVTNSRHQLLENSKTNSVCLQSMVQSQDLLERQQLNNDVPVQVLAEREIEHEDYEVQLEDQGHADSKFLTGIQGRTIRRFQSIERSSTIPMCESTALEEQFVSIAAALDNEAANQYDFLAHNKAIVNNPAQIRLTAQGQLIHSYRQNKSSKNPRNFKQFYQTQLGFKNTMQRDNMQASEAVRQCDCHSSKQKQEEQGYLGLINLKKRTLDGINSQSYNSLDATQNIRLKPKLCLDRTQAMTRYFKKNENRRLHRNFATFLTTLDHEEDETSPNNALKDHMDFQQVLDPNMTEAADVFLSSKECKKLLGHVPKSKTERIRPHTPNQVFSKICQLIQTCQAERKMQENESQDPNSLLNQDRLEVQQIKDRYEKMDMTLTKYIDLEKIDQENIKATIKELLDQLAAKAETREQGLEQDYQTMAPQSESLFSGENTARKRGLASPPGSSSCRRQNAAGEKSNTYRQMSSERQRVQEADMDFINDTLRKQQVVLSLKDIYIDLMRNQKLDYENFYGPQVIAKCIEEKKEMTQKVSKLKKKRS